jgi:L-ascorbate metabolism protein UlaG (beta-lactamase superfamily)
MRKQLFFLFFIFLFIIHSPFINAGPISPQITLIWLGHSCFVIESKRYSLPRPIPLQSRKGYTFPLTHFKILIDPYGEGVGYPIHPVKVNVVFVSHEHFDHNNVEMAPGAKIYRGLKEGGRAWNILHVELSPGIWLTTVGAYHDHHQGAKRGLDSISIFDLYGIRIVHLGDLGTVLTSKQIKAIGHVDVLLIPVGGFYTIGGKEAQRVVAQLKPKIVIPMHYKTSYTNPSLPIQGPQAFLREIHWPIKKLKTGILVITKANLPRQTTIFILTPVFHI